MFFIGFDIVFFVFFMGGLGVFESVELVFFVLFGVLVIRLDKDMNWIFV